MYEVELKVRADHDAVRDRLDERGAEPVGRVTQVDTYYDAPTRSFAETDEALRIRREQTPEELTVSLTYKGPLVEEESKTREERETGVEDGEAARAILKALDCEAVATVEKRRERFALDGHTVTLDDVADLGEYVEVETNVETESDVEAAREGAAALLERLGLDPEEQIRTSYLELLLEAE